jgi:hypothetical protein
MSARQVILAGAGIGPVGEEPISDYQKFTLTNF